MFLAPHGDHFTVELRGSAVQAAASVWAHTDAAALAQLFTRLAAHESPWTREACWESMEGELSLSATCSPRGEVRLSMRLRGALDTPEEWQVSATLTTDFGQLPAIAADARQFFGAS